VRPTRHPLRLFSSSSLSLLHCLSPMSVVSYALPLSSIVSPMAVALVCALPAPLTRPRTQPRLRAQRSSLTCTQPSLRAAQQAPSMPPSPPHAACLARIHTAPLLHSSAHARSHGLACARGTTSRCLLHTRRPNSSLRAHEAPSVVPSRSHQKWVGPVSPIWRDRGNPHLDRMTLTQWYPMNQTPKKKKGSNLLQHPNQHTC
jgi:hypothetical protein